MSRSRRAQPASAVATGGANLVFVIGAPRSGTSWLQRLLGAHPDIVTTQETGLLNAYCAPLFDAWQAQLRTDEEAWRRNRNRGLPAVLTSEEFEDLVVAFASAVYAKTLSLKAGARVVVDKNPEYSLHLPLLRRMFPDAAVLHILRDGRDVADSIVAAGRGWGQEWAPRSVRFAADTWKMHVVGARLASDSGRYLEIHYEDLVADTAGALNECLLFAGVESTLELRAALVEQADTQRSSGAADGDPIQWSGEVTKRLGGPPPEPEGFFRSGVAGGWRHSWKVENSLAFDTVAGDVLGEVGYPPDPRLAAVPRRHHVSRRIRERSAHYASSLGWRLHMALGRRGLYVQVNRTLPYPPKHKKQAV